jgi:hypothetical protein
MFIDHPDFYQFRQILKVVPYTDSHAALGWD